MAWRIPTCQIQFFCDFDSGWKKLSGPWPNFLLIIFMPDQAQKTRPVGPTGPGSGGDGPLSPKVEKPNTEELLKRMRKVDPDQAKRYRQRTGQ